MGFEAFYILMPVCLLLSAIGLGMFLWALHTGQLDDLETPAMRVLFDDDSPRGIQQDGGLDNNGPESSIAAVQNVK